MTRVASMENKPMRLTGYFLVPLMLGLLVGPLWAQEVGNPLEAIQAKAEIGAEDAQQIQAFITERVQLVSGDEAADARRAASDLRQAFDGSDAFKSAYTAAYIEIADPAVKKANLVAATRLLAIANTFNTIEMRPLLVEALGDNRVGIRATGAVGLRLLRQKLGADRDVWQQTLEALKEAGKSERSREVLRTIYAAMNYAEVGVQPDARVNAAAVLELLEERAKQYTGGTVTPVGADDAGLRAIRSLSASLGEPQKKRLVLVVATMMKHAIVRYTMAINEGQRKLSEVSSKHGSRELLAHRNAMERLIVIGEEILQQLLEVDKKTPVTENMKKLNTPDMKNAWIEWNTLLVERVEQGFALPEVPAEEEKEDESGDEAAKEGE